MRRSHRRIKGRERGPAGRSEGPRIELMDAKQRETGCGRLVFEPHEIRSMVTDYFQLNNRNSTTHHPQSSGGGI